MSKEQNTGGIQKIKSGLFYGYIIAIIAFCIIFISYGIRFSYGVFFKPISSELGWSSATTSLAYSVSMILEGVFNIFAGAIIDKYGPRLVLTISGILIGLGYCLIPTVSSGWQFFVFYGGIVGVGMGGIFIPLVSIIARWFAVRRTLATGLVSSSVGAGMLVVSPVANQLIITYDWRMTFLIFGILILLVTVIGAQFLKRDPTTIGLAPYGEKIDSNKDLKIPAQGLTFKEVVHFPQFWFVLIMILVYGFCRNSVNIHIVPDATNLGITATVAAAMLGTIGGFEIAGRIGLGLAADRIGNRSIFRLVFILFAMLTFWLPLINATWAFFIFAAIFGCAQGGIASSQSPLMASLFGLKSHGLLFGFCGFSFTLGAALGPYVTGHLFDSNGSYQIPFLICSIISLIAFGITLLLKPLKNISSKTIKL